MKIKGRKRKFFEEKSFIFRLKTILMMGNFYFSSFCSMSHSTALLPSKFINDFCLLFFPISFFAPSPISFILARNLKNKSRTINFEGKEVEKFCASHPLTFARVFEYQNPRLRSENFSFSNFLFFEKKFFFNMLFFLCCKKSYKNFFFFKNFVLFRRKNKKTLFLF